MSSKVFRLCLKILTDILIQVLCLIMISARLIVCLCHLFICLFWFSYLTLGNYYDRIDNGLERRSCATLPSPRASPRKLPKTPSEDRSTTPAKRNPLVRMKSDPLVDVEKRAKISRTIGSIQSTFRPISMLNLVSNKPMILFFFLFSCIIL